MLAGGVPKAVAVNVRRFLDEIRERNRWSFNAGFALAPDTNISSGFDVRTIYIPVFGRPLPFQRDAAQLTTSGVGVSVWVGAEYQVQLAECWRLRAGGQAAQREHEGSQFDQLYLATQLGPLRWLMNGNTVGSLLLSARQRWTGIVPDNREFGARLEVARRLTPRVTALANASWHARVGRRRPRSQAPPSRCGGYGPRACGLVHQAARQSGRGLRRAEPGSAIRRPTAWPRPQAPARPAARPVGLPVMHSGCQKTGGGGDPVIPRGRAAAAGNRAPLRSAS